MCGYIDRNGSVAIARRYKADRFPNAVRRFSEDLAAVEVDGKWGYIDKQGRMAVPPQFETAEAFSEGLAAVEVDGKYGFIDKSGEFVIKPRFDLATKFSDGFARVIVGWNKERKTNRIQAGVRASGGSSIIRGGLLFRQVRDPARRQKSRLLFRWPPSREERTWRLGVREPRWQFCD